MEYKKWTSKVENAIIDYYNEARSEIKRIGSHCPEVIDGVSFFTKEVYGGSEGEGETHYVIIEAKYEDEVSFWKIPGWYNSYDGAYLEIGNMFQVKPVEKTVIDWQ